MDDDADLLDTALVTWPSTGPATSMRKLAAATALGSLSGRPPSAAGDASAVRRHVGDFPALRAWHRRCSLHPAGGAMMPTVMIDMTALIVPFAAGCVAFAGAVLVALLGLELRATRQSRLSLPRIVYRTAAESRARSGLVVRPQLAA
jgi:hypothetical protein